VQFIRSPADLSASDQTVVAAKAHLAMLRPHKRGAIAGTSSTSAVHGPSFLSPRWRPRRSRTFRRRWSFNSGPDGMDSTLRPASLGEAASKRANAASLRPLPVRCMPNRGGSQFAAGLAGNFVYQRRSQCDLGGALRPRGSAFREEEIAGNLGEAERGSLSPSTAFNHAVSSWRSDPGAALLCRTFENRQLRPY